MSTELTAKDRRLFDVVINHAECIDWLGITMAFNADSASGEYLDKAIQLIPKGSDAHFRFKKAVAKCLPEAKRIHHHWLVKALASILQPDDNGNSISPLLILLLETRKGLEDFANERLSYSE